MTARRRKEKKSTPPNTRCFLELVAVGWAEEPAAGESGRGLLFGHAHLVSGIGTLPQASAEKKP